MQQHPHFNALSDWTRDRHGYVTLADVDHVHSPTSGVLLDFRWSVSAFVAGGELASETRSEQIEDAAEHLCSELGIAVPA